MDYKQVAAEEAVKSIRSGMRIGLGAGATIAHMVTLLSHQKPELTIYTSSAATQALLEANGFFVADTATASHLDLYFDGCDQFDVHLHALKSGGGIHTMEKLLAAMADAFVLVGDEEKFVPAFTSVYPLVLEVLPQAAAFVPARCIALYEPVSVAYRVGITGSHVFTANGNLLLELRFPAWPLLSRLQQQLKSITGVVETSLFYGLATQAIIAGVGGIQHLQPQRS